jgi:hypothetical protein
MPSPCFLRQVFASIVCQKSDYDIKLVRLLCHPLFCLPSVFLSWKGDKILDDKMLGWHKIWKCFELGLPFKKWLHWWDTNLPLYFSFSLLLNILTMFSFSIFFFNSTVSQKLDDHIKHISMFMPYLCLPGLNLMWALGGNRTLDHICNTMRHFEKIPNPHPRQGLNPGSTKTRGWHKKWTCFEIRALMVRRRKHGDGTRTEHVLKSGQ